MKRWLEKIFMGVLRLGAHRKKKEGAHQDSAALSRPQRMTLHGVRIEKAPVGRYLDLIQRAPELLISCLDAAFPGQKPAEILTALSGADENKLRDILTRLCTVVPGHFVDALCELMGADAAYVKTRLSPSELLDVWQAFWKMNDYTVFFQNARKALTALRANQQNTGSSDGSPAPQA